MITKIINRFIGNENKQTRVQKSGTFSTFVLIPCRPSLCVSPLTGGPACVPPDHCRPPGLRSSEGAAKRGRLQPQDPQQSQKDPA